MGLQHGILGFLNYGPCSGYELTKAFQSSLHFFLACADQSDLSDAEQAGSCGVHHPRNGHPDRKAQ